MLKKYWKNIGMLILIIACVFNIMSKLVHKLSLNKEMIQSAQYIFSQQENENKTIENQKNETKNTETRQRINQSEVSIDDVMSSLIKK